MPERIGNHLSWEPLKLSEICQRLEVGEREVRYALSRGIVPRGMQNAPGSGHHREFDPAQAFWLAIVLRLKASGIQTPLAGEIAKWSERIKGFAVNLGWDWTFSPFDGRLVTENTWLLEVGDRRFVRMLTDAAPSSGGQLKATDWVCIETRQTATSARPIAIVQLNLTELARLLLGQRTLSDPR